MKPYNDKVGVFGTQDNITPKVWARKLYNESKKDCIFKSLDPDYKPATFTKKDIKRWWDQRKLDDISVDFDYKKDSFREEAKNKLCSWFKDEMDNKMFNTLSKEK